MITGVNCQFVRIFLYDENLDHHLSKMQDSMEQLVVAVCSLIFLASKIKRCMNRFDSWRIGYLLLGVGHATTV